jgi:hypothetical protein
MRNAIRQRVCMLAAAPVFAPVGLVARVPQQWTARVVVAAAHFVSQLRTPHLPQLQQGRAFCVSLQSTQKHAPSLAVRVVRSLGLVLTRFWRVGGVVVGFSFQ